MSSNEIPQGDAQDNDYVSRPGESDTIPVQSDNAKVEDPIDAETADSDAQLEKDDKEAIDSSNILDGDKTRHAKPQGGYKEPGDTEGLPEDDGTSAVAK